MVKGANCLYKLTLPQSVKVAYLSSSKGINIPTESSLIMSPFWSINTACNINWTNALVASVEVMLTEKKNR